MVIYALIYPLNMVIFHSHVSLPEGKSCNVQSAASVLPGVVPLGQRHVTFNKQMNDIVDFEKPSPNIAKPPIKRVLQTPTNINKVTKTAILEI